MMKLANGEHIDVVKTILIGIAHCGRRVALIDVDKGVASVEYLTLRTWSFCLTSYMCDSWKGGLS